MGRRTMSNLCGLFHVDTNLLVQNSCLGTRLRRSSGGRTSPGPSRASNASRGHSGRSHYTRAVILATSGGIVTTGLQEPDLVITPPRSRCEIPEVRRKNPLPSIWGFEENWWLFSILSIKLFSAFPERVGQLSRQHRRCGHAPWSPGSDGRARDVQGASTRRRLDLGLRDHEIIFVSLDSRYVVHHITNWIVNSMRNLWLT
jgi:hypothetical protein